MCCSSVWSRAGSRPSLGTGSVRCIPSGKHRAIFNTTTVHWRITQALVESLPRGEDASLTLALMSVGVEKAVEAAAGSFERTKTRTLKHKQRWKGIWFRWSHYNVYIFFLQTLNIKCLQEYFHKGTRTIFRGWGCVLWSPRLKGPPAPRRQSTYEPASVSKYFQFDVVFSLTVACLWYWYGLCWVRTLCSIWSCHLIYEDAAHLHYFLFNKQGIKYVSYDMMFLQS